MGASPTPVAFHSPAAFRAWLARHHASARELLVRCYKVHAKAMGITYAQALDEALCFGWIDGVRRSVDADSFCVRFTPRRTKSIWSAINIKRAGELEAAGLMRPAGLKAFRARTHDNSRRYSFESPPLRLPPAYARKLQSNRRAHAYFESRPPWYRRTSTFWVMSAKREETRARRLGILIACSQKEQPIPPLIRPAPSAPRR